MHTEKGDGQIVHNRCRWWTRSCHHHSTIRGIDDTHKRILRSKAIKIERVQVYSAPLALYWIMSFLPGFALGTIKWWCTRFQYQSAFWTQSTFTACSRVQVAESKQCIQTPFVAYTSLTLFSVCMESTGIQNGNNNFSLARSVRWNCGHAHTIVLNVLSSSEFFTQKKTLLLLGLVKINDWLLLVTCVE